MRDSLLGPGRLLDRPRARVAAGRRLEEGARTATRALPNGIAVSPDGETLYVDLYLGDEVRKLARRAARLLALGRDRRAPTTCNWTPRRELLVASHNAPLNEMHGLRRARERRSARSTSRSCCSTPTTIARDRRLRERRPADGRRHLGAAHRRRALHRHLRRRPPAAREAPGLGDARRSRASRPARSGAGFPNSQPWPNWMPSSPSIRSSSSVSRPSPMIREFMSLRDRLERAQHVLARGVLVDAVHERAVDLDELGRELEHGLEARVARAGVVERELEAELAVVVARLAEDRVVVDRLLLGDLEHHVGGRRARSGRACGSARRAGSSGRGSRSGGCS